MIEANSVAPASDPPAKPPMSRGQLIVLVVSVLLATLDGYDLSGMAMVAPAVGEAWHLDKATLGFLLSTSLMGMAIGSIGLSPLADVVGRKPLVFSGVLLMSIGSLLSALSDSVPLLASFRILTGIGIGVMVPLTTTIAAEFSNPTGRSFAVAATTTGFAGGSVLGGIFASVLLKYSIWSSVFVSGAVAGLILLPIIIFCLQESPVYLLARRPPNALKRINKVLLYLGRKTLDALPEAPATKRVSYAAVFSRDIIGKVLTYAAVMILVSTSTYYLLNWLPQLITDAGFTPAQGSLVATMPSLVGIVAGLLWGLAANHISAARLAGITAIGFGCTIVSFGFAPPILIVLTLVSGLCGVFAGGTPALFYTTMAATLPPHVRVSAIGLIIGLGRVFSVSGPILAGWMFAAGLARLEVSLIFACAPIAAGILLLTTVGRNSAPLQMSGSGT